MMVGQSSNLAGVRVLVVEDELLVLMDVEDLLEEQGCHILDPAANVNDALKRISQYQPDLVILDRNLNGTRSTPVAEELNRAQIPYVVITGYETGVGDEPAMKGAPCIRKPWNRAELVGHMQRLVR
jgi:CheY-like chemotaxis protein